MEGPAAPAGRAGRGAGRASGRLRAVASRHLPLHHGCAPALPVPADTPDRALVADRHHCGHGLCQRAGRNHHFRRAAHGRDRRRPAERHTFHGRIFFPDRPLWSAGGRSREHQRRHRRRGRYRTGAPATHGTYSRPGAAAYRTRGGFFQRRGVSGRIGDVQTDSGHQLRMA